MSKIKFVKKIFWFLQNFQSPKYGEKKLLIYTLFFFASPSPIFHCPVSLSRSAHISHFFIGTSLLFTSPVCPESCLCNTSTQLLSKQLPHVHFCFFLFLLLLFFHFASHYFSFGLDYEREEQMCEKCCLAPEATARLPESVTSINPLVTPGKAYWEMFFFFIFLFSNENPGCAERINIQTWRARWNTFLVMWIYLTHPSGDESNEKCHSGRHLGGDWTRSYPSRPVTFRFLSSRHSRRLPIAMSGDVKSNKKTTFPHFIFTLPLMVNAH